MLKAARAEIADAAKAGEANASTAHHYASALHIYSPHPLIA